MRSMIGFIKANVRRKNLHLHYQIFAIYLSRKVIVPAGAVYESEVVSSKATHVVTKTKMFKRKTTEIQP